MTPRCKLCDDRGTKDYAGFGMDPCECRLAPPVAAIPVPPAARCLPPIWLLHPFDRCAVTERASD
jgi:hypothetical protein